MARETHPTKTNWRIIFRFEGGEAFDIDFVDYH
jgi:plasmid maintenance system killer protein